MQKLQESIRINYWIPNTRTAIHVCSHLRTLYPKIKEENIHKMLITNFVHIALD